MSLGTFREMDLGYYKRLAVLVSQRAYTHYQQLTECNARQQASH